MALRRKGGREASALSRKERRNDRKDIRDIVRHRDPQAYSGSRVFPRWSSSIDVGAAPLRHIAGTKRGMHRYLDMTRLKEMDVAKRDNGRRQICLPLGAGCDKEVFPRLY